MCSYDSSKLAMVAHLQVQTMVQREGPAARESTAGGQQQQDALSFMQAGSSEEHLSTQALSGWENREGAPRHVLCRPRAPHAPKWGMAGVRQQV